MEYRNSTESAMEFASAGRLEEWVHAYLITDGRNKPFSDGLKLTKRHYLGPVNLPLNLFTRCCGPEDGMKWKVDPAGFEAKVAGIMAAMENGTDLPPMIIHYSAENGIPSFELTDGNHRYEAAVRLGLDVFPVIIWITEDAEYDRFLRDYGKYFGKI